MARLNVISLEAMAHGRVFVVEEMETRWFLVQERVEFVEKCHADLESGRGGVVGGREGVDVSSGHYDLVLA